jgi:hypothetical protein
LSGISFFVSPSLSSLLSVLFGAFSFIFRVFFSIVVVSQVIKSSSRLPAKKKARARRNRKKQTELCDARA